ncbi:MAG: hypothetical protein FJ128_12645 [Deltaproteobacteria bacterium]|nr:hypothetical protein [Deltaproteobacteria bacterium]
MTLPTRRLASGAELQDVLLREVSGRALVVVPHQRLARQVWHRRRQAVAAAGGGAWEPLRLLTLEAWWAELLKASWAPVVPAPPLVRLALWQEALRAAPPFEGAAPDLGWAAALDDSHQLLARHLLLDDALGLGDDPLTAWRQEVFSIYTALLREGEWLAPGEVPSYLRRLLAAGRLPLPQAVFLVGLETAAEVEEAWLKDVARLAPLQHLHLIGQPENVKEAVVLPDPRQEMEWVAARVVEAVSMDGVPLHRLAVTSPLMDREYAPVLERVLAALLGQPEQGGLFAYNFSRGPALAETPLCRAALVPLKFIVGGERREDLASLLLSPFFGALKSVRLPPALADRRWREERREAGWPRLRPALAAVLEEEPSGRGVLEMLDQAFGALHSGPSSGREWLARLRQVWRFLDFPALPGEELAGHLAALRNLLDQVESAVGGRHLSAGEVLEWLQQGAERLLPPGPGAEEAGLQVLGLLEMRGLDFDRVFCLGLNAGALPAGPRFHPLLTARENALTLGGTHESQQRFARELWGHLLASAPHLVLTRPRVVQEEENVAFPLWGGEWREEKFCPLSRPHPAWVSAPPVRALLGAQGSIRADTEEPAVPLPCPTELRITQADMALACPCRFLLEVLLALRRLPEIESGLSPLERGERLHRVLADFVEHFLKHSLPQEEVAGQWARDLLEASARRAVGAFLDDPHWQAEWRRWFGDDSGAPGLLWAWLDLEAQRLAEGWRWQRAEALFAGLRTGNWPFLLRGRIDRIDQHADGAVMLWDYKTGRIPTPKALFNEVREFQLPGYLLALRAGAVGLPEAAGTVRAGYIGLRSPRRDHLKFADYAGKAHEWDRLLDDWADRLAELGRRLRAGDYRPDPRPPDPEKGPCLYCPYLLVCGYRGEAAAEEGEDGEDDR